MSVRETTGCTNILGRAVSSCSEHSLALVPERALNRGLVREFTELAKKHHWGRRKLKRSMKTYFFIAMAGLIVCAMTAVIVIQMKQQISPD